MNGDTDMLETIRDRLHDVSPGDWQLASDANGMFVEARTRTGMLLRIADFDPGASNAEIEFMVRAPEMVRYLVKRLDGAIEHFRKISGKAAPAAGGTQASRKNYAAEAAMKCEEPAFLVFLEERYGLERPLTKERAAQKIRSICGVTSRRDFNNDDVAAERWRKLRSEYDDWRKRA